MRLKTEASCRSICLWRKQFLKALNLEYGLLSKNKVRLWGVVREGKGGGAVKLWCFSLLQKICKQMIDTVPVNRP